MFVIADNRKPKSPYYLRSILQGPQGFAVISSMLSDARLFTSRKEAEKVLATMRDEYRVGMAVHELGIIA